MDVRAGSQLESEWSLPVGVLVNVAAKEMALSEGGALGSRCVRVAVIAFGCAALHILTI